MHAVPGAGRQLQPPTLPPPAHHHPVPPLQLLNVDGTSISGLDTDRVAQRLRGPADSSVWVKVARRRAEIPGVAGMADVEYKQFRLRRAQVELNPVFATTMHTDEHVFGGLGRVGCAYVCEPQLAPAPCPYPGWARRPLHPQATCG